MQLIYIRSSSAFKIIKPAHSYSETSGISFHWHVYKELLQLNTEHEPAPGLFSSVSFMCSHWEGHGSTLYPMQLLGMPQETELFQDPQKLR